MRAGWWDAPLTLRDLAEAIHMIERLFSYSYNFPRLFGGFKLYIYILLIWPIKQIFGSSSCVFNTLGFLSKYSFMTIRPDFMDPSFFIYLSFIIPPQWFNSFIDTTIQRKYMVLFHLFCFLLCTNIRLKIRVLITNLFQLYYTTFRPKHMILFLLCFLSRVLNISSFHFHTTVRPKYMVPSR